MIHALKADILRHMFVGVYGLGRFGSFWASCLAASGCRVAAYSRSDHPLPPGVERGSEDEVLNADVLFFAVSISSFESVLERVGSRIGRDTIVMDTCSVKIYPAKWMREHIPSDRYMIATHPMFGPDSGASGIKGLPIVMCPKGTLAAAQEKYYEIGKQHNMQKYGQACKQF